MNSKNNQLMKKKTDNVQQCKRISSFPVQAMLPSKVRTIYANDNSLNKRIESLSVPKPYGDRYDTNQSHAQSSNGFDIMSKNIEHTPVSSLFFSKRNIDALQFGLQNTVFNKSGGTYNIGKQNELELKIVMRSVYFDYLKNGFTNISFYPDNNPINNFDRDVTNSVRKLNGGVLEWCSKEILTNIQQFTDFKKELERDGRIDVMERPQNMNITGTKNW
jgi:hypothetical protein